MKKSIMIIVIVVIILAILAIIFLYNPATEENLDNNLDNQQETSQNIDDLPASEFSDLSSDDQVFNEIDATVEALG